MKQKSYKIIYGTPWYHIGYDTYTLYIEREKPSLFFSKWKLVDTFPSAHSVEEVVSLLKNQTVSIAL